MKKFIFFAICLFLVICLVMPESADAGCGRGGCSGKASRGHGLIGRVHQVLANIHQAMADRIESRRNQSQSTGGCGSSSAAVGEMIAMPALPAVREAQPQATFVVPMQAQGMDCSNGQCTPRGAPQRPVRVGLFRR